MELEYNACVAMPWLHQFCTAPPTQAKQLIEYSVNKLANYKDDPTAMAFGMDVSPQMMEVEGRVLSPPNLDFVVARTDLLTTDDRSPSKGQFMRSLEEGSWNLRDLEFRCIMHTSSDLPPLIEMVPWPLSFMAVAKPPSSYPLQYLSPSLPIA